MRTVTTLALATALAGGTHAGSVVAAIVSWRWTGVAVWIALIVLLAYLRFDTYWKSLL